MCSYELFVFSLQLHLWAHCCWLKCSNVQLHLWVHFRQICIYKFMSSLLWNNAHCIFDNLILVNYIWAHCCWLKCSNVQLHLWVHFRQICIYKFMSSLLWNNAHCIFDNLILINYTTLFMSSLLLLKFSNVQLHLWAHCFIDNFFSICNFRQYIYIDRAHLTYRYIYR